MAKFSDEFQRLKFFKQQGKCQNIFFNFCQIGNINSKKFQFPSPFMKRFLKEAYTSKPADFHVVVSEENFTTNNVHVLETNYKVKDGFKTH